MTTQQILNSGEVCETTDTLTLQQTLAVAQEQIRIFSQSSAGGPVDVVVERLTPLCEKIMAILNRRHGLDGMTPVQP